MCYGLQPAKLSAGPSLTPLPCVERREQTPWVQKHHLFFHMKKKKKTTFHLSWLLTSPLGLKVGCVRAVTLPSRGEGWRGHPGLHSQFQDSQGDIGRPKSMGVVAQAYNFRTSAVGTASSKVILSFRASLGAACVSETLCTTKQY